jgi:hypothetical protein
MRRPSTDYKVRIRSSITPDATNRYAEVLRILSHASRRVEETAMSEAGETNHEHNTGSRKRRTIPETQAREADGAGGPQADPK